MVLNWLLEWICRYSRAAIKKKDSDKTSSKDGKLSWLDGGATTLKLALSKRTKKHNFGKILQRWWHLDSLTNVGDENMIEIVKTANSL